MTKKIETIIQELTKELEQRGFRRFTEEERRTFDKDNHKHAWYTKDNHPANFEVLLCVSRLPDFHKDHEQYANLENKDQKNIEIVLFYNLPQSMIDEHADFRDSTTATVAAGEKMSPKAGMMDRFLKRELLFSSQFHEEEMHYPCIKSIPHPTALYTDPKNCRGVKGVRVQYTIDCVNKFPENIVESLVSIVEYASVIVELNYKIVIDSEKLRG